MAEFQTDSLPGQRCGGCVQGSPPTASRLEVLNVHDNLAQIDEPTFEVKLAFLRTMISLI